MSTDKTFKLLSSFTPKLDRHKMKNTNTVSKKFSKLALKTNTHKVAVNISDDNVETINLLSSDSDDLIEMTDNYNLKKECSSSSNLLINSCDCEQTCDCSRETYFSGSVKQLENTESIKLILSSNSYNDKDLKMTHALENNSDFKLVLSDDSCETRYSGSNLIESTNECSNKSDKNIVFSATNTQENELTEKISAIINRLHDSTLDKSFGQISSSSNENSILVPETQEIESTPRIEAHITIEETETEDDVNDINVSNNQPFENYQDYNQIIPLSEESSPEHSNLPIKNSNENCRKDKRIIPLSEESLPNTSSLLTDDLEVSLLQLRLQETHISISETEEESFNESFETAQVCLGRRVCSPVCPKSSKLLSVSNKKRIESWVMNSDKVEKTPTTPHVIQETKYFTPKSQVSNETESILSQIYGDQWKCILPKSEQKVRTKLKINHQNIPQTERKYRNNVGDRKQVPAAPFNSFARNIRPDFESTRTPKNKLKVSQCSTKSSSSLLTNDDSDINDVSPSFYHKVNNTPRLERTLFNNKTPAAAKQNLVNSTLNKLKNICDSDSSDENVEIGVNKIHDDDNLKAVQKTPGTKEKKKLFSEKKSSIGFNVPDITRFSYSYIDNNGKKSKDIHKSLNYDGIILNKKKTPKSALRTPVQKLNYEESLTPKNKTPKSVRKNNYRTPVHDVSDSTDEERPKIDIKLKRIQSGKKSTPKYKTPRSNRKIQRKLVDDSSDDLSLNELEDTYSDFSESDSEYKKKVTTRTPASAKKTTEYSEKLSFLASLSANIPMNKCHPEAVKFKNKFTDNKEELTKRLFTLYNSDVFENKIPDDTLIEWNVRLRGTAGYCYNRKVQKSTGEMLRQARIVLSTKVLDSPDRIRDTLLHELCHAATWIINGVKDGHGNVWKSWAYKAIRKFPELPPVRRCHNYNIATKFTYKCVNCGYSIGRHSKSLDTEHKRCGYCYGKFELLVNKKTKDGVVQTKFASDNKPTGFALFVKENYKTVKNETNLKHGDVMKLLGHKFSQVKIQ